MPTHIARDGFAWGSGWRRLALTLSGCLLSVSLLALDPARPLAALAHRQWLSEDGLPQDTVTALVEGRDGFLWIGTEAGLVRFDGAAFELYARATLPGFDHNQVQSLAEDGAGGLWIATSEPGLYRFRQGQLQVLGAAEGLPAQPIVQVLRDHQGTLWAAPAEGPLLRWDGTRFLPLLSDAAHLHIRALCLGTDGTLWAGTGGTGLWRVREGRLVLAALLADDISALAPGPEGSLWVGTRGHGLRRFLEGHLETPSWNAGLPAREVTALMTDRGGGLWIGLAQAGLLRHAERGLERAAPALGFHWTPRSLLEDRSGALWVGSEDRGLRVLYPVPFQTLGMAGTNPEMPAWMVCQEPAGTIWSLSGEQTLGQVVQGQVMPVGRLPGLSAPPTAIWPRRAGGLWVGAQDGTVFILEQGRCRRLEGAIFPLADPIQTLYEDPQQVLWVASARRGLLRLAPGKAPVTFPAIRGVQALAGGGADTLYVASRTQGLGLVEEGQVRWLGRAEGLRSSGVLSLLPDGEAGLWVGTTDGVRLYRDGAFHGLGVKSGPLLLAVHGLLRDDAGHLWLSTAQGVLQVSREALLRGLDGRPAPQPVVFDHHDGMASRETSGGPQPTAWRTADGTLYFPTSRGLIRRDPTFQAPPGTPLRLHILKSESDETVLPAGNPVRVPPGTHRFEVYYTATSPTRADKVRFRYRLQGWESTWNDVGDRRFSAYSNLPPGAYTFVVQAWRVDERAQPTELTLGVEVQPYLYQRPLFWGLAGALALAFGWWLIRLRLQQVEARTAVLAERNRMAREIHDHLAQGFTGVLLQLEAAEAKLARMPGDPTPILTRLDHARNLAVASLQEARRSVMALRPRRPEGTDLLGALRLLADRLLAGTDIQVELAVSGPPKPLKPRLEDELLRMAQELLTNSLRHGRARWVRAVLQFDGRWVRLSIEDDGKGFDPKADAAGYGMRSIREGVRQLGGHLDIDSTPGFGSRITINLPTRRWLP